MQDNAGHILTNFAKKNRTLQSNEEQILKLRTMQDNAGLYTTCLGKTLEKQTKTIKEAAKNKQKY